MIATTTDLAELTEQLIPANSLSTRRTNQLTRVTGQLGQLQTNLWEQLPYAGFRPSDSARLSHLLDAYTNSSDRIEHWRTQVSGLFAATCKSCIHGIGEDTKDLRNAMQVEFRKLLHPATLQTVLPHHSIDTELSQMQLTVVHKTITEALEEEILSLLRYLVGGLAELYRNDVIGSIEWANESTCRFEYPRLEISHDGYEEQLDIDGLSATRTEINKYKNTLLNVEHFLHGAKIDYQHRLPPDAPLAAEHVWRSIPDFLSNFSSVVKGELFRQRKTELDAWETGLITHTDLILSHQDPAIVLFDQLVLTGWADVPAEANRKTITLFDTRVERPEKTDKSATQAVDPKVRQRINEIRDVQFAFENARILLFVPFIATLICSFFPARTMLIPCLLAIPVAILWTLAVVRSNRVHSRSWSSRHSVFRCLAGVCFTWSAITTGHALAHLSYSSAAVGITSVALGMYFWLASAKSKIAM